MKELLLVCIGSFFGGGAGLGDRLLWWLYYLLDVYERESVIWSRRSNAFRCAIYVAQPRPWADCCHHWLSNCEIMTVKGAILSLILVLVCTASFAQQTGTGAKGKVADPDSLAAWYEKTLQLSGITVTGRAADKKVTVEKTSINPSASVTAAHQSVGLGDSGYGIGT